MAIRINCMFPDLLKMSSAYRHEQKKKAKTEGLSRGLSINDAGCAALLALMTSATDTNLIARSDVATQQKTAASIKKLLDKNPYPDRQTLEQLDLDFIEKNLSPGGSADLLAICYFLYFLENES